ncbi:MAG TPA: hypothetical protein VNI54_04150 [Thermoanaerobaculia bacterium]|nr:hypothetical protein [Thermoanaerobaculia bacterium]
MLFRGSIGIIGIGSFYVNDDTNTVMGSAVTDAAAWYDRADWMGVHATPQASITIDALADYDPESVQYVVVDYDVPFKDIGRISLKTVNRPKAFFVPGLTPCADDEEPARKLRALLAKHPVPRGTERKYFHTIEFFDHVADSLAKKRKKARKKRDT